MNYEPMELLKGIMTASGRLEKVGLALEQKAQQAQAAITTTREQEERKFHEAMVALFRDQQQRAEAALRPKIARAWQVLGALIAVGLLVLAGMLLLLEQAHDRLELAQSRADAAEVRADVQRALQHVDITSCGGKPCVRIDRNTPIWNRGDQEYVLVDGSTARTASH